MKEQPLVSVIIPAYNRANSIRRAIDSVISQTYNNIEITVVDDGSIDNTEEIIAFYGDKVRYIYKANGGCSSARNIGIKESRGDFIAFLDSDDSWYPDKIKKQMDAILKKDDYGLCICDINFIDKNLEHLSFSNLRAKIPKDGFIMKYLLRMPKITCSYMLVKKGVFSHVGLFDETFATANDFEMMLRICNSVKTILVNKPLVLYKKSSDSVSNQLFTNNRIRAIHKIGQYSPKFVQNNKKQISAAIAKIKLSYAEDLLWNRYLKESRGQICESLSASLSFKALLLYIKSILISCLSSIFPAYRDKGSINAS